MGRALLTESRVIHESLRIFLVEPLSRIGNCNSFGISPIQIFKLKITSSACDSVNNQKHPSILKSEVTHRRSLEMLSSWKSNALGVIIRVWMFNSGFHETLSDRVEISTPLNSWKRGMRQSQKPQLSFFFKILSPFLYFLVIEGVYLHQRSQSPYEGDVFHETPTGLVFYSYLLKLNFNILHAIFILCDVLTAFVLTETTRIFFQNIVSVNLFFFQILKLIEIGCR
jgi:hypothetical protein